MITSYKQISAHFHSREFKCRHCGEINIDENLVNKLETVFSKLNASKCIVSSGYRCPTYDKRENGFVGQHGYGRAADVIYYDKNDEIIPSKIVICVANDLGIFGGIARINNNYTHLDNRTTGKYRGDETRGNSNYWTNPYTYFGVSASDVAKYTGDTPSSNTNVITYVVKSGDTLSKIASNYSTTYQKIASDNNISNPNIISVGQVLKIYTGNSTNTNTTGGRKYYKKIKNCKMLNLRTIPSYGNNIYKAVNCGTVVEYLGMEKGWAKIVYEGRTLYCGSGYLG